MFYNINSSFELKESLLYVAENEESYFIEESEKNRKNIRKERNKRDEIHQKHDKSFKDALADPREMAFFWKNFVNIDIEESELQEYKNEFITRQYEKNRQI